MWDGSTLAGEIYGETAAQKFTVTDSTEGIGIALRSTGDTAGITVQIYPWLGSYGTSIAGTAVASEEIEIYADESDGVIALNNLPAGDYVLYVHSGYGGAGLELNKEGEGAYRDGNAIDGEYVYWLYDEYDSTAYAEKQAARGTGSSDAETNTTYVPITGGASAGVDKKYINGLSLELAVNDVADTQTYIKNHRGDVTALLNGNNIPIANYTYNAYGTERSESFTYSGYFAKWGADTNPIRYAEQYLDNETENYYLRARYYSPYNGRFTQEDPIRDGLNWYSYCAGNPVMLVDPWGLKPTDLEAAIMAKHIYNAEEDNEDTLDGGWQLITIIEGGDSMKMGVYGRIGEDGEVIELACVFAGSDSMEDWKNNVQQPFGASNDMYAALDAASTVMELYYEMEITFVGHSKGGAEAAACAVYTNRACIVFNPAAVNLAAYELSSEGYDAGMMVYVVFGEPLNTLNILLGAVPIDGYELLPFYSWDPMENHSMDAVISGLKER